LLSPDFAKLAEAFGLRGVTVNRREQVVPAVREARRQRGTTVFNFLVEQEDSVFPMVPSGAALHQMIRRPSPLVETASEA
jgi:acetolactate synthase-1/2/3 large subunit